MFDYFRDKCKDCYYEGYDKLIYNKNYSMFLKGNIGKDGEEGIIKDIVSSEKCIYLIKNSRYSQNWQTPTKVTDYIKNNLYLVDSVYIYDCYVTKAGEY